jgi:hypothetical protein
MKSLIPPITHRLAGKKRFNFSADSSPSQRITVIILKHPLNALPLIVLTALGTTMRCIDVHLQYAHSPISSSPSPRVAVVNPVHQLNARSFILLTALGVTMCCSDVLYSNAYHPISFSPSLRITITYYLRLLIASSLIALTDESILT